MAQINIKTIYPNNPEYDYETFLDMINLDREREHDILNNNGFIISEPQNIKKDIKDPNSIFSTKFGQSLKDVNPFGNRYKCQCGHTTQRINNGTRCPMCGTLVRYVDDNFEYFGWILLKDPYYVIHPNLYKSIENIIGKKNLDEILKYEDKKDIDGFKILQENPPADRPYFGKGMMYFKEHFKEILDFYRTNAKQEMYDMILKNKDKVFIQSIPVYTTYLRPFDLSSTSLYFEGTNAIYNIIAKLAKETNSSPTMKMNKKAKSKNQLLYDIQNQYNQLYEEIVSILSGKKGTIRTLFGGRYSFTSRDVIISDVTLRVDQVSLPYECLLELCQQQIINILKKSYNIGYDEAYNIWYAANTRRDENIVSIINSLINNGLYVLINRNPSIQYGSILCMRVVKMSQGYVMGIPLQILPLLAADFDGDCLNVMYIINKDFLERAIEIFNPRNAMYISRNDGYFDNQLNHQRDQIINMNTFVSLGKNNYSKEQLNKIYSVLARRKQVHGF